MKYFALHPCVNKLEFAYRIFNQLPEALPLDVLTCQSSFGKRKSTRCCGFMFFINSKASWGMNIFFTSLFGTKKMCHRRPSFALASWRFRLPFALFYQSFSSSPHNTEVPHFFNSKIILRQILWIIHTYTRGRSGTGVLSTRRLVLRAGGCPRTPVPEPPSSMCVPIVPLLISITQLVD